MYASFVSLDVDELSTQIRLGQRIAVIGVKIGRVGGGKFTYINVKGRIITAAISAVEAFSGRDIYTLPS